MAEWSLIGWTGIHRRKGGEEMMSLFVYEFMSF